jgi:hypothetical protein
MMDVFPGRKIRRRRRSYNQIYAYMFLNHFKSYNSTTIVKDC